jgi:hypothetical protein
MNGLWKFIYVTDMQPGSPRSFRFNPAWTRGINIPTDREYGMTASYTLTGEDEVYWYLYIFALFHYLTESLL